MAMRVNNNISALKAKGHLTANSRELGVRLERLASATDPVKVTRP